MPMMDEFGDMTLEEMQALKAMLRTAPPLKTPFDVLCASACAFAVMTLDRMIAEKRRLAYEDRGS